MAEQRFCKPQVGGSIPLASSRNSADDSTSLRFAEVLLSPRNSGSVTVSVTIHDTDESHTCQMSGLLLSATQESKVMPHDLTCPWPFHFGKRTKNEAPQ